MSMVGTDINFAVSTEGLDESGKVIEEQARKIREALENIEKAKARLESWRSQNKDAYEAKMKNALPKMNEMSEVVNSYGTVARTTANRLRAVENRIKNTIS